MDVGIVTPRYPPNTRGGGEISVQLLAEQLLSRTDHSVQVHSFDGNSSNKINDVPVTRHRITPRIPEVASIVSYLKLKQIVHDVDVLHGYNMELHPAIGFLSDYYDTPSVAHLNAYTYVNKRSIGMSIDGEERIYNDFVRPVSKPIVRNSIKRIDRLIALSETIGEIYSDYLGSGDSISYITNMIDPDVTPASVKFDISDPPRILYIGSLATHKGVQYLVKAINYIDQPIDVRIVGDGDQKDYLKDLASGAGPDSQIQFTGRVPYNEISSHYEWADLFVHPGIWPEPLNRTLLEAMQHGLTTVVTDRGGPPETIQDSELIVHPKDPVALAGGIKYGIENRRITGQIHRSYVTKTHHPKTVVPQIDSLYQEIS